VFLLLLLLFIIKSYTEFNKARTVFSHHTINIDTTLKKCRLTKLATSRKKVKILVSIAAKLFFDQFMDSLSFMQVLEIRVFL